MKGKTIAIIGGGVSGLAAAGLLSKHGLNVKIFEANDKIGGSCSNTNIQGYHFNDGAVYLALPGILDHVFETLGLDRQSLLPLKKITANTTTILPDNTTITFGDGFDIRIQSATRVIDSGKLQNELIRMIHKWGTVLDLFCNDLILHPFSLSRFIAKGWYHLPKFRGSIASELNKLFSDDAVRSAMSGILLYAGLPPEKMPVISILGLVTLFTEGFYLPEGGMGKISDTFAKSVINNGGEIFLKSPVRQIVLKNRRVCAVDIVGQGLVEADAIISTVSGMSTFKYLMHSDDVPAKMKKKVISSPLSHKAFTIQLGLRNTVNASSHLYNIIPMMDKQYELFNAAEKKSKWTVYTVPTVTMPELASQGGSIIEMYPAVDQQMSADEWLDSEKEREFESAISTLSQWHDLDIAAKRIISPKEYRDQMHLYKGTAYGLSPVADPRAQYRHDSPISGLYLAGQTTYPGYGIGAAAMSGIFAAEKLMKHIN